MAKKLYLGIRLKNFIAKNIYKAGRQLDDEEAVLYQRGEIPDAWTQTPSWLDIGKKKPPASGMAYVQSPYTQGYTNVYGSTPIADLSNYRTMYRTVPIIKAAIDTTVNMACGKGFKLECESEEVKEYLDDFFKKINTTEIMLCVAHDSLVYGNAYLELCYEKTEEVELKETGDGGKPLVLKHFKGSGEVVWLKTLDPYYMRVRQDAFSNIFGYIQWVGFPPVSLSCEKIAHFKWSPKSWSYENAYGTSCLMSLIKIQDYVWQLERDMQVILHTFSKPILTIYGGTAEKPYTANQMKDLRKALGVEGVAGKYFMRGDCKVEAIPTPANLQGINGYFNYLIAQRLAILGVPPVLMGMPEGTNRATSEVTFTDFLTRVRMLQEIIADVFEDQVFRKILTPVFGEDVEIPQMIFNEVFDKDLLGESARLREEYKSGLISKNEARIQLGYDPTELEEDNIAKPVMLTAPSPFMSAKEEDKKKDYIGKEKIRKKVPYKPDDKRLIEIQTSLQSKIEGLLKKSQEHILSLLKRKQFSKSGRIKKKAQDYPYDYDLTTLILFTDEDMAEMERFIEDHVKVTFTLGRERFEEETGKEVRIDEKGYISKLTKNSIGYISNLDDEMQERLRESIAEGIKENLTYAELSTKISDDFGFASERSKCIAVTELGRVHTNAYIAGAISLGVKTMIWNASEDSICELCLTLDGEEIPIEESFDVIPNRSHPHCHCYLTSKIEDMD